MDHGDGVSRLSFPVGGAPAEREIGDVDLVIAQDRTNLADYAGNIAISHINQISFQRRLHVNPVKVQQSRCVPVKHSPFDQMLFACGLERDGNHAASPAGAFWLSGFVYLQAA